MAFVYCGGQPTAGEPAGPGLPYFATNAWAAVREGSWIYCALLEDTAYELVVGMPNGKKILTNYSSSIRLK